MSCTRIQIAINVAALHLNQVYIIHAAADPHMHMCADSPMAIRQQQSVLILQFIYHSLMRSLQIIITIIAISIIIVVIIASISGRSIISNEVLVPITSYIADPHVLRCSHSNERMCSLAFVFEYITEERKTTTTELSMCRTSHRKGSKQTQLPLGRPSVYTIIMYVRAVASWYRAIVWRYFFLTFAAFTSHKQNGMHSAHTHSHTFTHSLYLACYVYKHIDRMWS